MKVDRIHLKEFLIILGCHILGLLFMGGLVRLYPGGEPWASLVFIGSSLFPTALLLLGMRLAGFSYDEFWVNDKEPVKNYLTGYVWGIIFFSFIVLLMSMMELLSFEGMGQINPLVFILAFIAFGIQGFHEELVVRGFLQRTLLNLGVNRQALITNIILTSIAFSLMHSVNPHISWLSSINIAIIGMIFALMVINYRTIWLASAFHSSWNFLQAYVYGLPVSGFPSQSSLFKLQATVESDLHTGGAFGVEGSIIVTGLSLFLLYLLIRQYLAREEVILNDILARQDWSI